MIFTAIVLGLIVILGNFVLLLVLSRRVSQEKAALMAGLSQEKAAIMAGLRVYFEQQGDQPSEFSKVIDLISDRFGVKVANSLKATFMGVQSGEAKGTKRLEGAIAQDMVSIQSPMLGQILQSFPALAKLLNKHPGLAGQAQTMLAGMGKGNRDSEPDNGGGSYEEIKFI